MPAERRSGTVVPLALAAIVIGLGLRFYALRFGLPAVFNQDEMPILSRALAFGKPDLNPHNFLYPTLYFYALFVWEGLFFVAGRLMGWFPSLAAFQGAFFVEPAPFVLAGRALTVVLGVLTLPAVYRLGARLYGRTTGVLAAAFLAVAPFAVRDAHYVKHDVPVTLMAVLALIAIARLITEPGATTRPQGWIVAGVLSGLAMSTHYYAIALGAPLLVVALTDAARLGWSSAVRALLWAALGAAIGFVAGSPFLLVEPHTALRDIVANRQIVMDRAVAGGGAFASVGAYLRMLETDAIGWPVSLAAATGLVVAFVTDWRKGLLLVSFPIALFVILANTVPANRYLNPMLPSLAIAAGFAIAWVASFAGRQRVVVAGILGVAAALPGLLGSLRSDRFFLEDDTRAQAAAYIAREIPAGSSILIQPYSVPLRPSREGLIEALRANLGSETRATQKFQLALAANPYPSPAYRTIYLGDGGYDPDKIYISPSAFTDSGGLAPLRDRQVTYVALKLYNVANSSVAPLRAALERGGHLVATFSPYRGDAPPDQASVPPFLHNTDARIDPALERPGPVIEIWRID